MRMFEWGHSQQILCFRSPGNTRVTRIRFNHQGNKVRNELNACFQNSWRHIHFHQSWLDDLLLPSSDVVVVLVSPPVLSVSPVLHWCLPALFELRQLVSSMRARFCLHSQSCCLITFSLRSVYSPSVRALFSLHFLPAV